MSFIVFCFTLMGARPVHAQTSLATFTGIDHQSFADRIHRGDAAACGAALATDAPSINFRTTFRAWVDRAEELVEQWRTASRGDQFYAQYRARIDRVFEHLISLRDTQDLSAGERTRLDGRMNELRFISAFDGYVAPEPEADAAIDALILRAVDLAGTAEPATGDVADLIFELAVLRGQEYLRIFKARGSTEFTPRNHRLDVLQHQAECLGRRVRIFP